jgi:predicted phosphodiesterase
MRVAVISDIHGNLAALEAVLQEVDAAAVDTLWCLGDLVGYGPRPNECCALVEARTEVGLAGNHDLGVLGTIDLDEFSPDAAASARWTRAQLAQPAERYLGGLEPAAVAAGVDLFHGSPLDPVWDYVVTWEGALAALEAVEASLVLVGHSHVALAVALGGGTLEGGAAPAGTERELGDRRWLLNPGSVGQPRDGDARAAWLLLDLGAGRASFRRVEYPVERTQAEIRERGLPDALAERLAHGL